MDGVNNIDFYYNELLAANPLIEFEHVYNENEKFPLDKIFGVDPTKYTDELSLLFGAVTSRSLEFSNGKPPRLVKYKILVCVAQIEKIVDHINYPGADNSNYPGLASCYDDRYAEKELDTNSCNFYDEFFMHNPSDVSIIECHGDKCRRSFHVSDTGVWCTSCHGDLQKAYNMAQIMYKNICFSNIPRSSILHIEKVTFDENEENVYLINDLLENDKVTLDNIQKNIDQTEELICQAAIALQAKKLSYQKQLNAMLETRGGSTEYNNVINEYAKKVEVLNETER